MATVPVRFTYSTGVVGDVFPGVRARLHGSWDRDGQYSDQWSITDMAREAPGDDSVSFRASVDLDAAEQGRWFHWGVSFVAPDGRETWAIPTEVKDRASRERYRSFQFSGQLQDEEYYLVHCTRLGTNKFRHPDADLPAGLLLDLAPTQSLGTADLHRRTPASPRQPRRACPTLTGRTSQSLPPTKPRRHRATQLPRPAQPPGHTDPQSNPLPPHQHRTRHPHRTHPRSTPRLRPHRGRHPAHHHRVVRPKPPKPTNPPVKALISYPRVVG